MIIADKLGRKPGGNPYPNPGLVCWGMIINKVTTTTANKIAPLIKLAVLILYFRGKPSFLYFFGVFRGLLLNGFYQLPVESRSLSNVFRNLLRSPVNGGVVKLLQKKLLII